MKSRLSVLRGNVFGFLARHALLWLALISLGGLLGCESDRDHHHRYGYSHPYNNGYYGPDDDYYRHRDRDWEARQRHEAHERWERERPGE